MALPALIASVVIGLVSVAEGQAPTPPRAYYLFLASAPEGCEDCYVPLLVLPRDITAVLITTYERDSIWKVERGVRLAAADVSPPERIVRLRGRRYRYQEIAPADVLRLLEKPEGTLP